jgi:hypothetical protein
MIRLIVGLTALAAVVVLASCSTPGTPAPSILRQSVPVIPPAALMRCAVAPEVPVDPALQSDVARYVVRLHAAGADCRSKLKAVRDWVETEAAEAR